MQNGGSMGTVMDIMFSDSIAEKRRKIELAEFDTKQQAQAAQDQQNQLVQQQMELDAQKQESERNLKLYEIDSNNATKLMIEEIKIRPIDKQLDLDAEINKDELLVKMKELQAKIDIEYHKTQIKATK
jgi:hypothetical protein